LTLAATGLTVLQAADSDFWRVSGWVLLAAGIIVLLTSAAVYLRRKLSAPDPPGRTGIDIEGGQGRFPGARISGQDTSVRARDTDIEMDDPEIK